MSNVEGRLQHVIDRIRAEYLEMPGLVLTAHQVERLCGLEPKMCRLGLDLLVGEKFLRVNLDGSYARLGDGRYPVAVKVDLRRRSAAEKAS